MEPIATHTTGKCVLGANRTHNLQIRSLSLCPIELRGRDIYLIPKIITKGKEFFILETSSSEW